MVACCTIVRCLNRSSSSDFSPTAKSKDQTFLGLSDLFNGELFLDSTTLFGLNNEKDLLLNCFHRCNGSLANRMNGTG